MLAPVGDVLTRKELNRATLARQMLLAREKTPVLRAVERLAGLQAQLARPPYVGLWSRVQGFRTEQLTQLAREGKVVRATLMRGTLHLVTASDYQALRATLQPMLSAAMQAVLQKRAQKLDIARVTAAARACLREKPLTFEELRVLLAAQFVDVDARALGYAVRTHLPLVQVPEDTRWGWPGAAAFADAEPWMGGRVAPDANPVLLVTRYLGAFGPASVRDAMAWSGMGGLEPAFEALRPKLRVFRDEKGRELFDIPDGPLPPGDLEVPVRFLPEYDNTLLGHRDRTRVIADEHRPRVYLIAGRMIGTILLDGFAAAAWRVNDGELAIEPEADALRAWLRG